MSTKAQENLTKAMVAPLINRLCLGYGIPGSDLQRLVTRIKTEEREEVEAFAGGQLALVSGSTHEVMLEATALRYLVDQLERAGRSVDPRFERMMAEPEPLPAERRWDDEDLGLEDSW